MGFIDLEVSEKQEGNICSCIQDAFINAGFLFGKDISKQLYKEVPPKNTKNTQLSAILNSSVVKNFFYLPPIQHFTKKKGGNKWFLLRHHLGTGVYIVYGTVESSNKWKSIMPLSMILIFQSGKENNTMALLLTTEIILI